MVDIARKIREIRKNLGLNQADFASAIEATQGSVSKWETGKERPRSEALLKIAKFSKMNLEALYREQEHPYGSGGLREFHLKGTIQPHHLVEDPYWDEGDWLLMQFPFPATWKEADLEGWLVRGRGINPIFPAGTVVVTASPHSHEALQPSNNDQVVAYFRSRSLWEVGVYRFVETTDGDAMLVPLDYAPYSRSIVATRRRLSQGDVVIAGVVAGTFTYHIPDHRLRALPWDGDGGDNPFDDLPFSDGSSAEPSE